MVLPVPNTIFVSPEKSLFDLYFLHLHPLIHIYALIFLNFLPAEFERCPIAFWWASLLTVKILIIVPLHILYFSVGLLLIFSPPWELQNLIILWLGGTCLCLFRLRFVELLEFVGLYTSSFGVNTCPLFLKMFSLLIPIWDSNYIYVKFLEIILQVTVVLFIIVIFQSLFSFCTSVWIASVTRYLSWFIFSSVVSHLLLSTFSGFISSMIFLNYSRFRLFFL